MICRRLKRNTVHCARGRGGFGRVLVGVVIERGAKANSRVMADATQRSAWSDRGQRGNGRVEIATERVLVANRAAAVLDGTTNARTRTWRELDR